MTIQNRPTNPTAPAEPVQAREQEATRRAAAAYGRPAAPPSGKDASTGAPADRVTISEEGRARLAAHAEREAAVQAGHEALDALPELSEADVAALRARVESGHYGRPEQTRQVAERLADALRGREPGA